MSYILGELYFGLRKGSMDVQNLAVLDEFLGSRFVEIVEVNQAVSSVLATC